MNPDVPITGRTRPPAYTAEFRAVLLADRLTDIVAEFVAEEVIPAVRRLEAAGYTTAAPALVALGEAVTSGTEGVLREVVVALDRLLEEEVAAPGTGGE